MPRIIWLRVKARWAAFLRLPLRLEDLLPLPLLLRRFRARLRLSPARRSLSVRSTVELPDSSMEAEAAAAAAAAARLALPSAAMRRSF